ncbi:ankyrin repeat domain-containing protein 54 isoform X2 [Bacillus rossius redtenbacheri]|uniref:ankyrin repeat domain-containing protein 54 isoform X2 n=1 Tax=Bacillus rossius redtenbacheri TaxID=93214 RepID=UPI002FDCE430
MIAMTVALHMNLKARLEVLNKMHLPVPHCEPPAGIDFCNIQPSLGPGNGYEISNQAKILTLAVYEGGKLQRKIRTFRNPSRHPKLCQVLETIRRPLNERRLSLAVSLNNVDLVKLLLEAGVNPSCSDKEGRTPLHLASSRGFTEIVRLLLDKGANPNMIDVLGNTPLHLAVCTSEIEVVTLLLKAGTDVNSNDHSGRSPLQLAQTKLKIIQQYGRSTHSEKLRNDVMQVIEMIGTYLQKRGQADEAEMIGQFSTRLTLSQTKEQVDSDVQDLLNSLSNLTLDRASTACS